MRNAGSGKYKLCYYKPGKGSCKSEKITCQGPEEELDEILD